ncbi:MAG: hypothetical protein AAF602_07435 [Myxococcota bacterium]
MDHTADAVLRSGRWSGYYAHYGGKYPQQMTVELADGVLRGGGHDQVGRFVVEGEYRAHGDRVQVGWIKTYDGAHSILYLGELVDGEIRGHWSFGTWPGRERFAMRWVARDVEGA